MLFMRGRRSEELTCRGSAWRARCPTLFLGLCGSKASLASVEGPAELSLGPVSHCSQENTQ